MTSCMNNEINWVIWSTNMLPPLCLIASVTQRLRARDESNEESKPGLLGRASNVPPS